MDDQTMYALTTRERDHLARMLGERKQVMRHEIRAGLAGMRGDGDDALLSGTAMVDDVPLTTLVTDVAYAEVARDAAELQDILAAEDRLAAGTYGICIGCDEPVAYARLVAYPTAKRCLSCQQVHEGARAAGGPR